MAQGTTDKQGQRTMAKSRPVTIASDQSSVSVSVEALPLPEGAATATKQDTQNALLTALHTDLGSIESYVDGLESAIATGNGKLDTIHADLAAIEASTSLMDDSIEAGRTAVNIITGQVGVAAGSGVDSAKTLRMSLATDVSLPAGSNAIGKLASNSGVDIGDVDVTSVVPGVTAASLGKAEDAAHASGDTGVMALGVSNEGNVNISGSDGDYTPIGLDREGNVRVVGDRVHDAVDSSRVIGVGGHAVAHGANPAAVAAADRTYWSFNRHGVPFVLNGHPNVICFVATYTSAQTNVAIVTVATGYKIVVLSSEVIVSAATTVYPSWYLGFGASTTPTTTGVVNTHPGSAAGSGLANGNGMIGVGGDGDDLRLTCSVPTGGELRVRTSYFIIES